jgi:hypothetical protein
MPSLKRFEGYVMVDHRNSPGFTEAEARAAGLPPGAGRGLFEAATITCSHCQTIVVKRLDRTRERAYCAQCDRYICDACGARYGMTRECRSIFRLRDQVLEAAEKKDTNLILKLTQGV